MHLRDSYAFARRSVFPALTSALLMAWLSCGCSRQDPGGFTIHVLATQTDLAKASFLIASYCQGNPNTGGCYGVDDITGSAIVQVIEREGMKCPG